MKDDKNTIAYEYDKLRKRIFSQFKNCKDKEEKEFLRKHLNKLLNLCIEYKNEFNTLI